MLFILLGEHNILSYVKNPLVVDQWSIDEYLDSKEKFDACNTLCNITFIALGIENVRKITDKKVSYLKNKIGNKLYWFYNITDLEGLDWNEKLNEFIYKEFLKNKSYKKNNLLSIDELDFQKELSILLKINNKILYKSLKSEEFYYLNLDFVRYFDQITFEFEDIANLIFEKSSKLILYDTRIKENENVTLIFTRLKELCLIDSRYQIEYLSEFFKDKEENILLFYEEIVHYFSLSYINRKLKFNFEDEVKSEDNILFCESYFSKIELTNIDSTLYPELNFPFKKGVVSYKYNGSNSATGRIYPINIGGYQALQTLKKDCRDVLYAEKNCFIIDLDFKSFEFDIINQLCDVYSSDIDPHIKIIEDCFMFDNAENYRSLGKTINYAAIYGSNIEKLIQSIVEDYELDHYDLIYHKVKNHIFFIKINELREKIFKNNYESFRGNVYTYFNRCLKLDKEHAIVNYYISGTAVDIFTLKVRKLIELFADYNINNKNKILLQAHDSVLFQLEDSIINDTSLLDDIIKVVEEPIDIFKVRYKISYGKNWKELI